MKPVEAATKYPNIEVICLVAPADKRETALPVARISFIEAAVPDSSTTVCYFHPIVVSLIDLLQGQQLISNTQSGGSDGLG